MLYTCNVSPCDQQAQIVKTDLAAIGIRVEVRAFTDSTLYTKTATPGEPFDIAYVGWLPDYQDPSAMLNVLLEGGAITPNLQRPDLPRAARRGGTAHRRQALPDLRPARRRPRPQRRPTRRIRQRVQPRPVLRANRLPDLRLYGIDLAALCIKHPR